MSRMTFAALSSLMSSSYTVTFGWLTRYAAAASRATSTAATI